MNAIRIQRADEPSSQVKLSSIRIDGGTQSRANVNDAVVEDYAAAMADGATFPKMVVFYDGTDHWLADGFHRHRAYLGAGVATVEADVRQGTRRDAILFSVGANATHGYPRSRDDKNRAVLMLVEDDEWSAWSDNEIRKRCGVSLDMVQRIRRDHTSGSVSMVAPPAPDVPDEVRQRADEIRASGGSPRFFTHGRTGRTTVMDVSGLSKSSNEDGPKSEDIADASKVGHISEVEEDEITAEDLANDPGVQKAAEALNAAKALYDEAIAMPAREPLTEQEIADGQRAFGTQEERGNLIEVIRVTELVTKLPSPIAMVGHIPPVLMHSVDVVGLLNVSAWFENFARAWEEKGASK